MTVGLVFCSLVLGNFNSWAERRSSDVKVESNRYLAEAKILYDNQQYKASLKRLKKAIRVKGTSRKDITEIYKYMGFIYIIQNQKKHAKRAFELLLKINPNYEMNPLLTSPKILDFFNQIKEKSRKKVKVIMRHTPLAEVTAAERIELKAYVIDLHKRLRQLKIYYRRRGDPTYSSVMMKAEKGTGERKGSMTYIGYIPFIWNVGDDIEMFVDYYMAAIDKAGRWAANTGTPKQPMTFRVNLMVGTLPPGARSTPTLESWWFWTLVGAGVVGLSVGGYFLYDHLDQPPAEPTTGQAILIPR
jgi:tetratricopeptide (TPR) repeat protein